jgi:hypothetical protein
MLSVLALALELGVDDELLPHAAAGRPSTATPDVIANFLAISFLKETTCSLELSLPLKPATDRMARRRRSAPGSLPPTVGAPA